MDDWTLDDLLALAGAIGERIDSGRLPRQDENGQYVFSDDDLRVLS